MFVLSLLACTSSPPAEPVAPPPAIDAQRPADNDGEPDRGRWNRARSAPKSEEIAQLEAIGYVGGEEVAGETVGVTLHDASKAHAGINFYVSGHAAEATLMAMDGTVLHRWAKPFREVWPERVVKKNAHGPDFWRRAALLPNGGLLAIYEGHGLVRLDRDSNVVWAWDGLAHHDLEVLPDGRIWVLSRKARVIDDLHPKRPVLEDFVSLLSPDGVELKRISVLDAVRTSGAASMMARVPKKYGDIFHTNSLEVLDGGVPDPRFAAGHLLLSMRAPSTVMVLDPDTEKMTWWHHGVYSKQHDPTILDNGHLLLFDNLGAGARSSAVREYTLPAMEPVWTHEGDEKRPFFSRFCGASQRLPNGNTLVSESGIGRAFEITASGEVVWQFDNPARAGENEEFVAIVPELVRVDPTQVGWLKAP